MIDEEAARDVLLATVAMVSKHLGAEGTVRILEQVIGEWGSISRAVSFIRSPAFADVEQELAERAMAGPHLEVVRGEDPSR